MYLSRATRPGFALATNWLARSVTSWTAAQDKELEQLVGYVSATQDLCLKSYVDVRGKKGELWLELWVDSDHAGEPGGQRRAGCPS